MNYTYYIRASGTRTVPSYRGHYSGTIYKNVKQGFTPPFDSATASRYTIYVSKNTVNNMADVNQLLATADTNFILIGSQAIKSRLPHVKFLEYGSKPIDELIQEALQFIADSNPYVSQLTTLAHIPNVRPEMVEFTQQGDTFILSYNNFEDEADPIIEEQWKITQDPNYFATSLGIEEGIQLDTWFTGSAPTQFSTTGKFTIHRRILDKPSTDPNFVSFNYLSNEPALEIFAHRRPIAVSTVNFTHVANGSYNITWVDSSFDFDHIGRRADKGIIEHVVRYRKNMGTWFYGVPTTLDAGAYILEHRVKDTEGTWSDILVQTFELSLTGAIQRSMGVTLFVPEEVHVNKGLQASRFVKLDNTVLASETIRVRRLDGSWDVPEPRVLGLSLSQSSVTLDITETHQISAVEKLDNESSRPIGGGLSYSTSNSTVASVSSTGLIHGVGLGTADILVEYQGIKKTMRVTVHPKPSSITVLPQSKTIKTGTFSTTQLTVMAHRASGFSSDITNLTSFTTNNPMAADVNSSGLVMAGGKEGTAVITARFEGFEAYFTITVEPADNPVPPVRPPRGGELFSLLSKTGEFASTQVFNESPTTLIETSKTFISSSVHSQQNVWQTLHRGTFFNPLFSLSNTGLYEVEYTATSTHGLSQTKIKQLRVIEKPIDMFARLKAQNPAFSTNSMPASENLVVYDAWTRHSETVSLEVSMLNTSGHTVVTPTRFWHNASDATDPNFPEDIW
ncbi:Ig-like domain-containing protein, partial [Alkaliphilus sp. AH-315-G20]|nr:Ig-like domain-containing protein [Alkaliphilus sp. AH-315-G20]